MAINCEPSNRPYQQYQIVVNGATAQMFKVATRPLQYVDEA